MESMNPAHIARLERCELIAAEAAALNPSLLPIFELIENELKQARALSVSDPLIRARMMVEQRRGQSQ